jgi:RNA polymerase sigma-70 factor, ECF subfamily
MAHESVALRYHRSTESVPSWRPSATAESHHQLPLLATASGSNDGYLNVFQSELNYVYRILRRFGVSAFEVEDLAQDAFLALRGAWKVYDPGRPIRPYLFGIAFRIASAHQRKRKREVAYGIVDRDDEKPWPDEVLQSKQARAMLLSALQEVPLPRRAVLVMHELDGIPMAEVAAVLRIPRFTAYSRFRKGRQELETTLRRMLRGSDRE